MEPRPPPGRAERVPARPLHSASRGRHALCPALGGASARRPKAEHAWGVGSPRSRPPAALSRRNAARNEVREPQRLRHVSVKRRFFDEPSRGVHGQPDALHPQ